MKLLVLGGTADARQLVERGYAEGVFGGQNIEVVYSIAGRVRAPNLSCPVLSGGFRQLGGLQAYLAEQSMDGVLDATHPFAARMSEQAANACRALGIFCVRLNRPAWQPQPGDNWHYVSSPDAMLKALEPYQNLWLTVGQIPEFWLRALMQQEGDSPRKIMVRTAVPPDYTVPESVVWETDIGPFALADELASMQQHRIDVLVSKDSGGEFVEAKLAAARALGVPVYLYARPKLPAADAEFFSADVALEWLKGGNPP